MFVLLLMVRLVMDYVLGFNLVWREVLLVDRCRYIFVWDWNWCLLLIGFVEEEEVDEIDLIEGSYVE